MKLSEEFEKISMEYNSYYSSLDKSQISNVIESLRREYPKQWSEDDFEFRIDKNVDEVLGRHGKRSSLRTKIIIVTNSLNMLKYRAKNGPIPMFRQW